MLRSLLRGEAEDGGGLSAEGLGDVAVEELERGFARRRRRVGRIWCLRIGGEVGGGGGRIETDE